MAWPPPLILASASPRRRALLEQVGLLFEVEPAEGEEAPAGLPVEPPEYARRCAEAKAVAVSQAHRDAVVLGADTVVVLADHLMGKPRDPQEAAAMLAALSGRAHAVCTGVALAHGGNLVASDVVTTAVAFRSLSEAEIAGYVAGGEPMDKAGAYGIQGRGALLVRRIEGCYFNVVGLPLSRAWEMLTETYARLGAPPPLAPVGSPGGAGSAGGG